MGATIELVDDPGTFLEIAAPLLAAEPVAATVMTTVSDRMRRELAAGLPAPSGFPLWWAVERDDAGRIAGAAMSTAAFVPHPVHVMGLSDEGARRLAGRLAERGEDVRGVNGALPGAEVLAAELARLGGRRHRVDVRTTLFVLDDLVPPPAPPGRARLARAEEVDQVTAWYAAFSRAAAEQAGRTDPHPSEEQDRDAMLRRIRDDTAWVWEDAGGTAVHLTGASRPMFGVARIGPVYTPPERRGRGYAGATVAAASSALLAEGARVCLFADQANPVSSALYLRLGFRRLSEQAHLVID